MFRTNTPEENARLEALNESNFKEGNKFLDTLKETLGLEELSDLGALELTHEQKKKIHWLKQQREEDRYFQATRPEDGEKMKAMIRVSRRATQTVEFGAEIFSPVLYEGWGGNHDFNKTELEESLRHAIEAKQYPYKKE